MTCQLEAPGGPGGGVPVQTQCGEGLAVGWECPGCRLRLEQVCPPSLDCPVVTRLSGCLSLILNELR